MAETITCTFNLLIETNKKLEQLASETFLRSKGNVIDWAVDELWRKLHPETIPETAEILSDEDETEPADEPSFGEKQVRRLVAAKGLDGQLKVDPGFH